jgi:hypothetical protein
LNACPLLGLAPLVQGTTAERNTYELSGNHDVIHWLALDEDIELSRLFQGGKSVESERSLRRWLPLRKASKTPALAMA